MELIDMSTVSQPGFFAYKLCAQKSTTFLDTKMDFLTFILAKTTYYHSTSIKLNRRQASDAAGEKRITFFEQAFDQVSDLTSKDFRSAEKPFDVAFAGEGGTDGGGLCIFDKRCLLYNLQYHFLWCHPRDGGDCIGNDTLQNAIF
jgi:hypothetical protein